MTQSYRQSFRDPEVVAHYEDHVYADRSYGALLSKIEQDFLELQVACFAEPEKIDYLDFACGTGRILTFVEKLVGRARGIEISPQMLELAAKKVSKAELVQRDISRPGEAIEGKYDLITSFRFFLNAEPALRTVVMQGLAARLKDDDSRLVFNHHAVLTSYKGLTWIVSRAISALRGSEPMFRRLTHNSVEKLVLDAGLEIEEVYGYDMLSSKALALLPFRKLDLIERMFAGSSVARRIGANRIYVVKLRK